MQARRADGTGAQRAYRPFRAALVLVAIQGLRAALRFALAPGYLHSAPSARTDLQSTALGVVLDLHRQQNDPEAAFVCRAIQGPRAALRFAFAPEL